MALDKLTKKTKESSDVFKTYDRCGCSYCTNIFDFFLNMIFVEEATKKKYIFKENFYLKEDESKNSNPESQTQFCFVNIFGIL